MVNYYYLMVNGKVTQTCFSETHTQANFRGEKPFLFDERAKHQLRDDKTVLL